AAADDRDPARQALEVAVRRLVGGDDPATVDLQARQGPGAGNRADDHVTSAHDLVADGHRAVRGEPPVAVQHRHLAPLEQPGQPAVQLGDDAALAAVHAGPVDLRGRTLGQVEAEVAGVPDR